MNKWADYGISEVRYDSDHTHITMVRVRPDNGDEFGPSEDRRREDVVDEIKKGTSYITIIKNEKGDWTKGQAVIVVEVNGVEYIKTVDNDTESDNLEELPEF